MYNHTSRGSGWSARFEIWWMAMCDSLGSCPWLARNEGTFRSQALVSLHPLANAAADRVEDRFVAHIPSLLLLDVASGPNGPTVEVRNGW
jgi:hypothetical protein